MTLVLGLVAALAVFVVCAWSGQTLARHHQDAWEIGAVVAIGVCVLGSLALGRQLLESSGSLMLMAIAAAAGAGLFVGYDRADRAG